MRVQVVKGFGGIALSKRKEEKISNSSLPARNPSNWERTMVRCTESQKPPEGRVKQG